MGDIGIDKWSWKMKEHKRKGHYIINYKFDDKKDDEKKLSEREKNERENFPKDQKMRLHNQMRLIPPLNEQDEEIIKAKI